MTYLSSFDMFHQLATQPSMTKKFPTARRVRREMAVGAWNEATPTMVSKRRIMRPRGVEMPLLNGPIRVSRGENQTQASAS